MFIQNRAKSIAQRLNAKNIAPLRAKIAEFADKIAESSAKFDNIISLNAKFKKSGTDSVESQNLGENSEKNAEFILFGGLESRVLERDSSFCESKKKQKLLKNPCEAPENSPASWCKKSDSKGAVVPPADFLLEAEKRGSPPKSEKRSFWRVGGAGRGVQPFCEKEKNSNGNAESNRDSSPTAQNDKFRVRVAESSLDSVDSAILSQNGLPRRFCESARNDDSYLLDSANSAFFSTLKSLLLDLKPWRKGPFNICGIEVQSEWDSAIKFNIIAPHLSVEGKVVADIGCNNGYYSFRLLPLRPSKIVCFEPSAHCKMQFDLINAFVRSEICFEMLGVEDLAEYDCKFDCILCLGVIYHRTNPLDCLRILKNALRARGELIIDTLIIEGEGEIALSPLSYAKMKNVYFIPSISAFKNWLIRAGFREIELLCVKKTTSEEQRKTAWSGGESLEDFLDKEDKNKTIEGYSAPTRAYFKAKI